MGNDDGWITVIAPNQPAIYHDDQSHINEEVTAAMIHLINGVSKVEQYNVNTGEAKTP